MIALYRQISNQVVHPLVVVVLRSFRYQRIYLGSSRPTPLVYFGSSLVLGISHLLDDLQVKLNACTRQTQLYDVYIGRAALSFN